MGEEDTGVTRAQHQPTGEEFDDHTASTGIVIREGRGVETVLVRVPGMDEFECTPDALREWLKQHGLVPTEREMSKIEERLTEILMKHQKIVHSGGDGLYHADDYGQHWDQQSSQRQEQINELQSQDWARMLRAWEQFHQQVTDLRSIADGNGDEILRQVGHTITALNMIVHEDWAPFCAEEFNAWALTSTDGLSAERLHAAAHAIVEAGELLYDQWYRAVEAGDYHSHTLSPAQSEFIAQCGKARESLHQ